VFFSCSSLLDHKGAIVGSPSGGERHVGKALIPEQIGNFLFWERHLREVLLSVSKFQYKNSFYTCMPVFSYEALIEKLGPLCCTDRH
jgi:hypothetical protein